MPSGDAQEGDHGLTPTTATRRIVGLAVDIVFMNDVADVVRLHSLDSSFEAAPILHLTWKQRPSYILPESGTHLPSYLKLAPILCHTDVLISYLEGRPVWCTHW